MLLELARSQVFRHGFTLGLLSVSLLQEHRALPQHAFYLRIASRLPTVRDIEFADTFLKNLFAMCT